MHAKSRNKSRPAPDIPTNLRQDRWQNLVQGAFLLEQELSRIAPGAEHEVQQRASAMLDNFLEVFTSSIDPVDDFEGYAVRRMLLAMRRAMDEQGSRPPPPRPPRNPSVVARRRAGRTL